MSGPLAWTFSSYAPPTWWSAHHPRPQQNLGAAHTTPLLLQLPEQLPLPPVTGLAFFAPRPRAVQGSGYLWEAQVAQEGGTGEAGCPGDNGQAPQDLASISAPVRSET